MTTPEIEEVNYETRDYDGIRWIRYDHYEHALHHQLQKARAESYEQGLRDAERTWTNRYHSELDQDTPHTN